MEEVNQSKKSKIPEIEAKWRKKWEEAKIFKTTEDPSKQKFYVLEMYPYPSGSGLHVGHAFNYTIGDIYARFKIMNGFNVLHPMGFDSFGLPAENAAIKNKSHPKIFTEKAIENFIKQQKLLGLTYDWDRKIQSHDEDYYKWDQWIFLKMFEKGLAYKKKAPVNWCPKCNTVLANEQVHNGKCWRHKDTDVEIKFLEQWFFKITDYADELYEKIDTLKDWPEPIKAMQKNWIGKSHGTEVYFEVNGEKWPIFTTRVDTIFGVTFLVISAQHPRLFELVTEEQKPKVEEFLKKIKSTSEKDIDEEMEKEGVFTGSYAINPMTNEKIPIYAGNFVVADYASGMVMAVPAHDQRDFLFAKKYNIPIKVVIQPDAFDLNPEKMSRAYTGDGTLINSGQFSGLPNRMAIEEIQKYLEEKGLGKKTVQYKLRDWLVSRQRFWGTPIPIVYCDKCGIVPVPEDQLPVKLPEDMILTEGGNPLASNEEFVNTTCPKCGGSARRETDTMDTFVNSSWYFLRYTDPKNNKEIFNKEKAQYWMPIDLYIGGAEHATMHLIYFRFYTKFLRDLGLIDIDEPAIKLFNQGMVHGEDGFVMSKSRGNVVDPLKIIEQYGADVLRLYLVSVASPDKDFSWSTTGLESINKFVNRVYNFFENIEFKESSKVLKSKLHKTIRDVTEYIKNFKYNLAVISLRKMFEFIEKEDSISKEDAESYIKLLNPFCPHITEELWEKFGNEPFISNSKWPEYDENLIDEKLEVFEELQERYVEDIKAVLNLLKIKKPNKITIIIAPEWKYKFINKLKELMETTNNPGEIIKTMMSDEDMKKHGQEISKLIPNLLKNRAKIPKTKMTREEELELTQKSKEFLTEKFNCEIEITEAEKFDHPKSKQAMPGKPAFLIE